MLDDDITLQEIIDTVHEFNFFEENDFNGDCKCYAEKMNEEEI